MNTELETIAPTKARVGISKCPVLPVVIYDRECNGLTNLKTASKVSFIPAKKEETKYKANIVIKTHGSAGPTFLNNVAKNTDMAAMKM